MVCVKCFTTKNHRRGFTELKIHTGQQNQKNECKDIIYYIEIGCMIIFSKTCLLFCMYLIHFNCSYFMSFYDLANFINLFL